MIKTRSTNSVLKETLLKLEKQGRKENASVWIKVAETLAKSGPNKASVNISKINKFAKEGETVIIPGKVLGVGKLEKKVTVVAFGASQSAKMKISKNGVFMDFVEIMKKNPKGSGLRILK